MGKAKKLRNCWILSAGQTGCDVQSKGVAEALGLSWRVKHLRPNILRKLIAPHGVPPLRGNLSGKLPDIVIAAGRQTVPFLRAIKKKGKDKVFTLMLLNPHISCNHFDMVWVPNHDDLEGENVITTLTSPHPIKRRDITTPLRKEWRKLPHPRIVVLVGGPSRQCEFTKTHMRIFCRGLEALCYDGASLIITTSRRTPPSHIKLLHSHLAGKNAWIWNGKGENPYPGMLGAGEMIVVTNDSVNMVSEAAITGRGISIFPVSCGSKRFKRFHTWMREKGYARRFDGYFERWSYPPVNSAKEISRMVRERMKR